MSLQKRVSKKEEALYEPILKALKRVFSCSGECYLEVTGKPRKFSDKLQEIFDDVALYLINVEGFFPDITGFVKQHGSIKIITVEVKPDKPMIKDIFQAKNYAQIFNAEYALLISTETISENRRRLILKRTEIISRDPYQPIIIARFNKETNFEIDKELYYGSLPEPFETYRKAFESENLTISDHKFKPIRILVTNTGETPVKTAEARLESVFQPSSTGLNLILNPKESTWINLEKYVLWDI